MWHERVATAIDSTTQGGSDPLTLHIDGSALVNRLASVRRRIAEWATSNGMASDAVEDVVLATHEALANVADHAYPCGGAEAWVEAGRIDADTLAVTVRDHGLWRPPPADAGRRGHGMRIIRGLAQRVEVRRGAIGTTVTMYWTLPERGPVLGR